MAKPKFLAKLLAVQVLRAFAALAVVVHHAQHDAELYAGEIGAAFVRSDLLPWLAGVDVFFVISGFIMVHASQGLFGRPRAPALFLERRIARIVPLYWAATILFLGMGLLAPSALNSDAPGLWQIVASFLFIPAARPDGLVQPVYSLGWTLNYEMLFYAVFACAIALPRAKAVLAVAVVLALSVLVGRLVALPVPLAFWSEPIVLEFVFGMGLGLLKARGIGLAAAPRLALGGLGLLLLHLDLTRADGFVSLPPVLAYGVPATLLVAAAALGLDEGRVPPFERTLAALGDASYALYLVHPFVIRALRQVLVPAGAGAFVPPTVFVLLCIAGSLVAALGVYRWFEKPVTGWLRAALPRVLSRQGTLSRG